MVLKRLHFYLPGCITTTRKQMVLKQLHFFYLSRCVTTIRKQMVLKQLHFYLSGCSAIDVHVQTHHSGGHVHVHAW